MNKKFDLSQFNWSHEYYYPNIDGSQNDPSLTFTYSMSWGYFQGEIERFFYDFGLWKWHFFVDNAVCPLEQEYAYFLGCWDSDWYQNGKLMIPSNYQEIETDYFAFCQYLDKFSVEEILDIIDKEAPLWWDILLN